MDSHWLAGKGFHQVLRLKLISIFLIDGNEDELAATSANAIDCALLRISAHGAGLDHLIMRPVRGMNIEATLAVRNFAIKRLLVVFSIENRRSKKKQAKDRNSFHRISIGTGSYALTVQSPLLRITLDAFDTSPALGI